MLFQRPKHLRFSNLRHMKKPPNGESCELTLKVPFLLHEGVNTAFHLVKAHPASRAAAFAIGHASARLATDGTIATVMQRVIWNLMLPEVGPYRLMAPVSHWIELYQVVARTVTHAVQLDYADASSGVRLLSTQTGYPAIKLGELVSQRQHFPKRTT